MNGLNSEDIAPISEQPMIPGGSSTISWAAVQQALAEAETCWLTTTRPDGRPHVMRVLAVLVDGALHFATSPASRKGRNLGERGACVVTTTANDLDLVLEGIAERLRSDPALQQVADTYASKYGWRVTVRDKAFHDTEGAPTAGPPPYHVYRVTPHLAFGLGSEGGEYAPTRWTFQNG